MKDIKKQSIEFLKIPKDIAYGAVIITLTGREDVYINNYQRIIEYTDTRLKLLTKNGKVLITGKDLLINNFEYDAMEVTGIVEEVKYY